MLTCQHRVLFPALQVRTLIQREMGAALQQYDALLCPAAPTPAYRVGEKTSDPLAMYKGGCLQWAALCSVLRAAPCLCGLPALSSAAWNSAAWS